MSDQAKKCRIISKLLRKRSIDPRGVSKDTVVAWFPSDEADQIEKLLVDLEESSDSPIIRKEDTELVLSGEDTAAEYLKRHNCDVPLGFDTQSTDSIADDSFSEVQEHVQRLNDEIEKITDSAEDWRHEARRRQRASILIGLGSFFVGVITGIII